MVHSELSCSLYTMSSDIFFYYSVFSPPLKGGFRANITVKGTDFDHSNDGDLRSNPREARESAAAKMLVKLQSMVGSS